MKFLLLFILTSVVNVGFGNRKVPVYNIIKHVNKIDVTSGTIKYFEEIVVLGNNIIDKKSDEIPDFQRRIIDANNGYIMQGLHDMHVHAPETQMELYFKLCTAAGITNCRIMKSNEESLTFAKKNKNIHLHEAYNFFGEETYKLDSIATIINNLKPKGYEFIKIFGVRDEAFFDEIMKQAKANKLQVCGHALSNINPTKVLASGYKTIEHVGYFDKAQTDAACDSLIDIAVAHQVLVCPTLDWNMMVYHTVPQDSLQYRAGYAIGKQAYQNTWDTTYEATRKAIPEDKVADYNNYIKKSVGKKIEILKKMRSKGLKIIAGSDAEEPYQTPGFSLIEELKWIQKAGFSNQELLQMVTTNADLFYINPPNSGYIILQKNPLDDINNLTTVTHVLINNWLIEANKLP